MRAKLLALLLGTFLAITVPAGAWWMWVGGRVQGEEACVRCHSTRTFDRHGFTTRVTEPEPALGAPSACTAHEWQRVGCWIDHGAWVRYAALPAR